EVVFLKIVVELGAGIRMSDRNLNRLRVEFFGELHRALDRLRRLAWKPDDKITVHDYAELLAVFHELAGLLDARALLDVLEDLWIARLETHNQQAASGILHRLERFVVGVNSRGARPRRLERLQLFTHGDRAVLRPRERVIIEENLL